MPGDDTIFQIIQAIISTLSSTVGKPVSDQILKEISYAFKYQSLKDLERNVEDLQNGRDRLKHSIEEARNQGDEIYEDVEQFLISVDSIIEGIDKSISKRKDEAKRKCCKGVCPDLTTRYKLNKKAAKEIEKIVPLLEKVKKGNFLTVSYSPPPPRIDLKNISDYEAFGSREETLKEINEALKDANFNMIGVYGIGGVGKTTLVKDIASRVLKEKLFETVVMAEVTQNPDFKNIQDKIAYGLGLKFGQESSQYERAGRLYKRLENEKNILIILDNIWEKLDLNAVGIPFDEIKGDKFIESDEKESTRICKLLLTSRNKNLLHNDMKTQKEILVKTLSIEEAMNLFRKTVGSVELPNASQSIIKKCAGLPLAIATMAKALKDKDTHVWDNALTRLEGYSVDATVFSAIEMSYQFLKSEEVRSIFVLCSLYNAGHEIYIFDLLRYGIGLDLFQDARTLEQKRNRVRVLIDDLKASCLLLDGDNKDTVKMHDMVHVVASSIASKEKHMVHILHVNDLEKDKYKESIAISLHFKEIKKLFEGLKFPNLKLFLLFEKYSFLEIPHLFFKGTEKLKVLDFRGIHFSSEPSSLSCLTNLQTLSLEACLLKDIAVVGELSKLEILSISHSNIEELDAKIGRLTRLKLLNLSNCPKLKVIAPNVISSLSELEELYMENSSIQWKEESKDQGRNIASLSELKKLSKLTAIHIHIQDARIMLEDFLSKNLTRFKIFIGEKWNWLGKYETLTTLKLQLSNYKYLGHWVERFKIIEDLHLDEMKGVSSILYQLDGNGFPKLKHLHVQNNLELLYIVESVPNGNDCFPMLESLSLYNLSIVKICHGLLHAEAFGKLKSIKVENCDTLEHLSLISMTKSISQLHEVVVTDCKNLKEIFGKESESHDHQSQIMNSNIEFSQLHSLTLQSLPQLISFDTRFEEINGENRPNRDPTALFNQKVLFPRLENLKLSSVNVVSIWNFNQPSAMSSCSQNLTSLAVEECNNLKYLFSSSMVQSLVQLEKLIIRCCKSMKRVIYTGSVLGGDKTKTEMSFPRLFYLELKDLPKLTRFGTGKSIDLPFLNSLHIESCPYLTEFFSNPRNTEVINLENTYDATRPLFDGKVALKSLEKMMLVHLDNLRLIWHNQLHASSFCNLKEVRVEFCEKIITIVPSKAPQFLTLQNLEILNVRNCWSMKSLFPVYIAKDLKQLKELKIFNCGLEEIVAKEEEGEEPRSFELEQLTILGLHNLPELKYFYHGLHTTKWPRLKRLMVNRCYKIKISALESPSFQRPVSHEESQPALFSLEKVMPNLEILFIDSCSITLELFNQVLAKSICKLKDLRLAAFNDELVVFPFDFLQRLYKFERLIISDCTIKELFPHQEDPLTPNLKALKLWSCHDLTCLVPPSTMFSFTNLTTLDLWSCNGLSEVLSCSTAKSLVQLEEMKIRNCDSVREIIVKGDETEDDHISFNQLKSLELHLLSSLSCFSSTNNTLNFPSLEGVVMKKCPEMKIFSEGPLNTPSLKRVQVTEEGDPEYFWKNDLNSTIKQIFTDMAGHDNVHHLNLSEFPQVKQIWHGEPPMVLNFYHNLRSLVVCECSDIQNAVPANLIWHLNNLETLDVSNCASLEQVFDLGEMQTCEDICQKNMCFSNLKSLKVDSCSSLRFIFTPTLIPAFVQLKEMEIKNCNQMEKIITKEGEQDANVDKILIPQVNSITLESLPSLTCFYSGSNILEYPSLKALTIKDCRKMEAFVWTAINAPLFSEKVVFPNLEELKLEWNYNMKGMWHGNFSEHISKLKVLELIGLPEQASIFPSGFFHTSCNLEKLVVSNAFFKEIFLCEEGLGCEEIHAEALSKLRDLKLSELPELLHLWKGSSEHSLAFQNLMTLEVSKCGKLENLVPSTVSFQNLISLEVSKCDKLKNLMTFSTAKSLTKLTKMNIFGCQMIGEIIDHVGEKAEEKIVFKQLEYLGLHCLLSLRRFYAGSCTLKFPSLQQVIVRKCPQMVVFSKGASSTPKLKMVQLTEEDHEGVWLEDLNSTVLLLFFRLFFAILYVLNQERR